MTCPSSAFDRLRRHCAYLGEKATSTPDEGCGAEVKIEKVNPFDDRPDVERDCGIATMIANHADVVVVIERPMTTRHDDDEVDYQVNETVNHVAFV